MVASSMGRRLRAVEGEFYNVLQNLEKDHKDAWNSGLVSAVWAGLQSPCIICNAIFFWESRCF